MNESAPNDIMQDNGSNSFWPNQKEQLNNSRLQSFWIIKLGILGLDVSNKQAMGDFWRLQNLTLFRN